VMAGPQLRRCGQAEMTNDEDGRPARLQLMHEVSTGGSVNEELDHARSLEVCRPRRPLVR
jgi:hypothetical protein